LKGVALGLLGLVGLLGMAERSEWSAGAVAMEESDVALARGDVRGAITHARRAAEAAVPFSPYPQEGYARLAAIARSSEQKGDRDVAGFAWRAVRSAAMATRPASVGRGHVAEAEDGIVRLARPSLTTPLATGASEAVIRAQLAVDEVPSPGFCSLVFLGSLALAAGLAALGHKIRARVASWTPLA
jgi:hypothetical protein